MAAITLDVGSIKSVKWKRQHAMLAEKYKCVFKLVFCNLVCHTLDSTLLSTPFAVISIHPETMIYHKGGSDEENENIPYCARSMHDLTGFGKRWKAYDKMLEGISFAVWSTRLHFLPNVCSKGSDFFK